MSEDTQGDNTRGKGSDGLPILQVQDEEALASWLAGNHSQSAGMWLMIPKSTSGESGPSYVGAVQQAIRFGWIDSQKAKLDESFFLQRFTPRRRRSRWSQINRKYAETIIADGRMEPEGLAHVDAARADGRWEAAYDSPSTGKVPDDLAAALDADPAAKRFFGTLTSANRYAILFRIAEATRAETRSRRIEKFVKMCADGETLY